MRSISSSNRRRFERTPLSPPYLSLLMTAKASGFLASLPCERSPRAASIGPLDLALILRTMMPTNPFLESGFRSIYDESLEQWMTRRTALAQAELKLRGTGFLAPRYGKTCFYFSLFGQARRVSKQAIATSRPLKISCCLAKD